MDCEPGILCAGRHDRNSCQNSQVGIRLGVANVRPGNRPSVDAATTMTAAAAAVAATADGDTK